MLKIPKSTLQILLVGVLVVLLALVRTLEHKLFYDPLLVFFKGEYQNRPLPTFDNFKIFISLFFRYTVNSALSLAIIFVIFKDWGVARFASLLYSVFFVILIVAFFTLIYLPEKPNVLYLFYVRRFIIQPLFLLLFVPAFFYQRKFPNA